jgi:RNA recognition motif-containing protein
LNEENKKKSFERNRNEDLNNTIFVRNVSFDTDESEFKEFFKEFGEIQFAKVIY